MQFAALVPRCRGLVAEDLATGRFEAGAPAAVDPIFYVGPACQAGLTTQTRCMAEAESQFSRWRACDACLPRVKPRACSFEAEVSRPRHPTCAGSEATPATKDAQVLRCCGSSPRLI